MLDRLHQCMVRLLAAGLVFAACVDTRAQLAQRPLSGAGEQGQEVHLVGSAQILHDRLRLTPAGPQQVGAAWFAPKQRVIAGFEAVFRFQLTEQGGLGPGADGFAFVLQNEGPNAIAGRGSAGGFAIGDGRRDPTKPGIPHAVAVFFDTFYNADGDDPSDNYVAICTNGAIPQMRWPPRRLGVGKRLKIHLKDRRVHQARILYRPPMMAVYLDDGEPSLRAPVDLSTVVDALGFTYAGFTASTGSGWENHDIFDFTLTPSDPNVSSDLFVVQSDVQFLRTNCLEGRNLCTPAGSVVEERGPGYYHVILPAQLEWGASVPNPAGSQVTIENARGMICQALGTDDSESCSGPDGIRLDGVDQRSMGPLVQPGSNPGALITKTETGRTWFSVNSRRGRGFARSQGFFEFDVKLK
jgi:hypothetical protein